MYTISSYPSRSLWLLESFLEASVKVAPYALKRTFQTFYCFKWNPAMANDCVKCFYEIIQLFLKMKRLLCNATHMCIYIHFIDVYSVCSGKVLQLKAVLKAIVALSSSQGCFWDVLIVSSRLSLLHITASSFIFSYFDKWIVPFVDLFSYLFVCQ